MEIAPLRKSPQKLCALCELCERKKIHMSIEEQIVNYLKNHAGEEVEFDTPLVEDGIIDSMGVMDLIAFIESTYKLDLDMDDLTIENFATITDIKNFILCKREES